MKAGRLKRRIIIQEPTETQGATGQAVPSWATYRTVWADVRQRPGRETFDADQILAETNTVFRIRYLEGLTRKMRISYGGDIYDIHSIVEIGFKEGHDIRATAKVE